MLTLFQQARGRWGRLAPAAGLAALALALRLQGLDDFAWNPDEGILLGVVAKPSLASMLETIRWQGHPPLFYLLVRLTTAWGWEPGWLRLLPAISGAAAVPVFYLLALETAGAGAAFPAALAMAVAPGALALSGVLRPYMTMLLLLLAALLFLARHGRTSRGRDLALFGVLLAAAVLTAYPALVVAAGLGLLWAALLARRPRPRREAALLAAAGAPTAAALGLLWLWQIGPMSRLVAANPEHIGYLNRMFVRGPADAVASLAGASAYSFGAQLAWPALLLAALGTALALRRGALPGRLTTAVAVAALALSAAGKFPLGSSRHSIHMLPFLALPAALLLGRLPAWKPGRALALAAALAAAWAFGRWDPLGLSARAHLKALPEMVVTAGDHRRVAAALREARGEPGLLLMDLQTHSSLIRFFGNDLDLADAIGQPPMRRFRWGRRDVVVSDSWMLTGSPERRGEPQHLVSVLRRLKREAPALMGRGRDVRVVYSGWGWPLVNSVRLGARSRGRRAVVSEAVECGGTGVFRLRAGKYLRKWGPGPFPIDQTPPGMENSGRDRKARRLRRHPA